MADSLVYIAIDFGTSFSGYAFSFMNIEQIEEQTRIPYWDMGCGIRSHKTPTCILFDEEQNFQNFGYDAMTTYTGMIKQDQAMEVYLFKHFKMELYKNDIHRDLDITASNGKTMKAIKVFSESLRFLKDHALEKIGENTGGRKYIATDATWVLTVPAIWHAAAKQFMREAAVKAGLVTDAKPENLIFALEPEAASVFCKQLPNEGFIAEFVKEGLEQKPGTQYMVVDCGGGTIDITVHEVLDNGNLKELHAASGNDMGGETVDKQVITFLKDIFSEELFETFEKKYPSDALKLKYDIGFIKSYKDTVRLQCPFTLLKPFKKNESIERYFEGVQGAEWDDGAILIKKKLLLSFFDESFSAIEYTIKQILKKTELNIEYMMLVGGYAECPILRNFIKKKFGRRHAVLCPFEPQAVVLKGAILYGKNPSVVKSRISALTYGVCVAMPFDETKHIGKRKYTNREGKEFCNVCFQQLVSKGESVENNEVRTFVHSPLEKQQTSMTYTFHSSMSQNVMFIDDREVKEIGCLSVNMPNTEREMDRRVRLEIQFGSTEMKATATDLDSFEKNIIKIDFMNK